MQLKLDELATNEVSLIKVRELSRNLSKEDRHTSHLQAAVKRIDDRWSKAQTTLEDRQKQLTAALESGPPKQFLSTMDAVLLKIKNMESQLGSEFLISDTASLEEQLKKVKVSRIRVIFNRLLQNQGNTLGAEMCSLHYRQCSDLPEIFCSFLSLQKRVAVVD